MMLSRMKLFSQTWSSVCALSRTELDINASVSPLGVFIFIFSGCTRMLFYTWSSLGSSHGPTPMASPQVIMDCKWNWNWFLLSSVALPTALDGVTSLLSSWPSADSDSFFAGHHSRLSFPLLTAECVPGTTLKVSRKVLAFDILSPFYSLSRTFALIEGWRERKEEQEEQPQPKNPVDWPCSFSRPTGPWESRNNRLKSIIDCSAAAP